jgi:hypothetical protein
MKTVLMLWASAWFANVTVTEYADAMEVQLAANRNTYLAGPHTAALQAAALKFYDQQWASLQSPAACGEKLLGAAGVACIADRAPGGRFPWQYYYRDPIALGHF